MQTEEIESGYKVVRINNKKHRVSMHIFLNGVRYYLKKWVTPIEGNGPLMIFKTPQSAKYCVCHPYSCFKIYRCKWVKSEHNTSWYLDKDNNQQQLKPSFRSKDIGYASKVMLTRLVKYEDIKDK
jgi:hypothetical protein